MMPAPIIHQEPKTLSFRRFRDKHIELSEIYWKHVIGAETVNTQLEKAPPDSFAVGVLGIATTQNQYGLTASATLLTSRYYLDRVRLHLLTICCANLESFLHDVTFCHIAHLGFKLKPGELSPSGEALGQPILGRASLPEPLKYASHLFGVDFGAHSTCLNRAYKYRCAVVHNGGMVTPKTIRDLSLDPSRLNTRLGYSWNELQKALKAAYEIAKLIDRKLSSKEFRLEEVERELCFLRDSKILDEKTVWGYFHDKGMQVPPKKVRIRLLNAVNA